MSLKCLNSSHTELYQDVNPIFGDYERLVLVKARMRKCVGKLTYVLKMGNTTVPHTEVELNPIQNDRVRVYCESGAGKSSPKVRVTSHLIPYTV